MNYNEFMEQFGFHDSLVRSFIVDKHDDEWRVDLIISQSDHDFKVSFFRIDYVLVSGLGMVKSKDCLFDVTKEIVSPEMQKDLNLHNICDCYKIIYSGGSASIVICFDVSIVQLKVRS